MNENKNDSVILDPAMVVDGWFQIDFDTFLIEANRGLKQAQQNRIMGTIEQLDLNHSDYVGERLDVVREYCLNNATYPTVRKRFPFIASEMARVSFDKNRKTRMRERFEQLARRGPQAPQ